MLELWQAEWCPHSHRVRERLTELGVDFLARQVPPQRYQRDTMRETVGTDSIPALVTDEGETLAQADEIIAWLDERYAPADWEDGHISQERAHGPLEQGAVRDR